MAGPHPGTSAKCAVCTLATCLARVCHIMQYHIMSHSGGLQCIRMHRVLQLQRHLRLCKVDTGTTFNISASEARQLIASSQVSAADSYQISCDSGVARHVYIRNYT